MRIGLAAFALLALPASAQLGPITASLERLSNAEADAAALVPAESAGCECCPGVATPPACERRRPSRRSLQAIGLAGGVAWGAGLGLSSQRSAEKALGPFKPIDTGITVASAVTAALLADRNRTCDKPAAGKPHGLDGWARRALKAKTVCGEDAADDYSYLTPPASFAAPFVFAATTRDPHSDRDALVLLEVGMITTALNRAAKRLVSRLRPYVEFCEPTPRSKLCAADATESFFSGHAALSFSSAVAAGQIASMRGQKQAPWVWATGLSVATTSSFLRMRADRHHLSDVLVGIGVGSLVGWAVPHFHRTRDLEPQPGETYAPPAPQISFNIRF